MSTPFNSANFRAAGMLNGRLMTLQVTEDWNGLRKDGVLEIIRDVQGLLEQGPQVGVVVQAQEVRDAN